MNRSFRRVKQGVALASAAMLTGALALVGTSVPAGATSSFAFTRISGADRFGTAADLAETAFPGGAATAIVATGFNFPDALAGNYLAGQEGAPILLVDSSGPIPAETAAALAALKTTKVIILGGTAAVGTDVAGELAATVSTAAGGGNITVTRISGPTRDDTAEAVDTTPAAASVGIFQGKRTAFLARDDTFPDALGAGPIAYAEHFPVILTSPTALSSQALATITALGIQQLLIVGGTGAISASVEAAANAAGAATLERFAGVDRSDTSHLLADYAITNFGLSTTKFVVASGDESFGGADALAAGPFAASLDAAPLLVTDSVNVAGQVVTFGAEHESTETTGYAVGGPNPLPDATLASVTSAASGAGTVGSYTVSPSTSVNLNISGGATENETYTVTGIPSGTSADIVLYSCDNVSVSDGAATFNNSSNPGGPGNAGVPGDTGSAAINQVNGASVTPAASVDNVTPGTTGSMTFEVTDSSAACVLPVVFSAAAGSNVLSLGTTNQPSIPYGIGGEANFYVAAPTGAVSSTPISAHDASGFTNAAGTYAYSASDVYQLVVGGACAATTVAVFEKDLSIGDTVSGTYNPPPAGPGSTFCLDDIAPTPPTAVSETAGGSGGVTVTFTGLGTVAAAHIVGYDVYRAEATVNGSGFLCPTYTPPASPQTPPTSPYTEIGSAITVGATAATSYTYTDTSVSPATPVVQYCYAVSSVDVSGEIGNAAQASQNTTGGVAPATSSTTPPAFASLSASAGSAILTATYNEPVLCSTVDTNGSDFTVQTKTNATPAVNTTRPVSSASCVGTSSTTVAVTLSTALSAGDGFVIITAATGSDANTVANTASPPVYQAVGNSVQTTTAI